MRSSGSFLGNALLHVFREAGAVLQNEGWMKRELLEAWSVLPADGSFPLRALPAEGVAHPEMPPEASASAAVAPAGAASGQVLFNLENLTELLKCCYLLQDFKAVAAINEAHNVMSNKWVPLCGELFAEFEVLGPQLDTLTCFSLCGRPEHLALVWNDKLLA